MIQPSFLAFEGAAGMTSAATAAVGAVGAVVGGVLGGSTVCSTVASATTGGLGLGVAIPEFFCKHDQPNHITITSMYKRMGIF